MDSVFILTLTVIALTLIFDFTNGRNDSANIIATVIASRAMTPVKVVLIVGFFEFIGPLLSGTAVANAIGKFVHFEDVEQRLALLVILCGLCSAILWNVLASRLGLPSSSSHALVGGLTGAVVTGLGSEHVVWGINELLEHGHATGVIKLVLALIISPLMGFCVGYAFHRLMQHLLRGAHPAINRDLRHAQYISTAWLAFSHGANDGQKSMGILTLVLMLGGFIDEFVVPFWVILACATALTLGILSGGWRIVHTLGFAIYKVRPLHAINSQLSSAAVILMASLGGAPVSTTHVVASSIMGIGASERPKAVRWGKAFSIVKTWVITIPASAMVAALLYTVIHRLDMLVWL